MSRKLTPQFLGKAALAAALGFAATGAMASTDNSLTVSAGGDVTRSVEVRISDLNLATASGQARLANRIDDAARRACSMHASSAIDSLPSAQACFSQARAGVLAQMETRGLAVPARLAVNTL